MPDPVFGPSPSYQSSPQARAFPPYISYHFPSVTSSVLHPSPLPASAQVKAPVIPCLDPPIVTIYRTRRGFLGSCAILSYVMWSQTPVEQHRLALVTMHMLPSTRGTVSAFTISVFRCSIAPPHDCCLRFKRPVISTLARLAPGSLAKLWPDGTYTRKMSQASPSAPHVPHRSLNQIHATFMPDAAQAVNRFPLSLSWDLYRTPVLTSPKLFRRLIGWFAFPRLSDPYLPRS